MRQVFLLVVALGGLGLSGCCKKGESAGSSGASPEATTTTTTTGTTATAAPMATAAEGQKRFAGVYGSTWGRTTFVEEGGAVTAKYPRGTLSCTASGEVLNCDWVEGSLKGKARLERQSNGDLKGKWGNGSSESNGGPWFFTRQAEAAGGAAVAFTGAYTSTWGPASFEQNGNVVKAKYARGTLACIASGASLNCDWFEGASTGKATLAKNADGTITGTWGNGGSASNGGMWRFSPK